MPNQLLLGQISAVGRKSAMPPTLRYFAAIVALAAVYFCAGKFGLSWAHVNVSVSAVWPPSGLALAALLLWGRRFWPGVFLGAFLLNLSTQGTVITTFGIAIGNTLEAVLATWALNRFANGAKAFERARSIFLFIVLGPVLSTIVSASFGVTSLILTGFAQWSQLSTIWLTWWLGDAVGELIFAPFVVIWMTQPSPQWKTSRLIEAASLLLLLLLLGYFVFIKGGLSSPEYVVILPLLWAAFRFGQRGAVTSALIMSWIALLGTLYGVGPYTKANPNDSLLHLQSFMSTLAVAALMLASVLSEARRAEQRLEVQESISRILAESPAIKEAAPQIIRVLCERAGWDLGAIWIMNRAATELQQINVWHLPGADMPEFSTATTQGRISRGAGLPGRVWSTGKAVWIRDVTLDPDFRRAPIAQKEGLHGAFAFPIKLGEQILGVIECFSREMRDPDDHFLQMVSDIGAQLGHFIERKRAEEELRAQRVQLRAVTNVTPVLLAQCSRDLTYTYVNRAYAATFGARPQEIVGKSLRDVVGAAAFESFKPYIEAVLRGEIVEFEEEVSFARAGRRFVRGVYTPELDEHGAIQGWIASVSDFTDRKRTEDEIAALNRQLAADLSAMIRLQTLSTRFVQSHEVGALMRDVLDAAIEITATDSADVWLLDRQTNELKIVAQNGLATAFVDSRSAGDTAAPACEPQMASGERIIVEDVGMSSLLAGTPLRECMLSVGVRAFQSTPLVSRSGQIVGKISTYYRKPHVPNERDLALLDLLARQAADFVERSATEALLLHREEHLRAVIETAVDGIITIDEHQLIKTANPAAERIFGYSASEMVGQSALLLMPAWSGVERDRHGEAASSTEKQRHAAIAAEVQGKRKDGTTFPVDLAVSETRIGEQPMLIAIVRDIAERRRADDLLRQTKDELVKANEELEGRVAARTADLEQANAALLRTIASQKKLEEQLRQAQKMESIGTLAGGIAHDFNNILNIIRGYAMLIAQQPFAADQLHECLAVIDKEIDRGASVVRQLLTVARKTETHLAPINASEIVLTLNDLIKTFPKNITVTLNLDARLMPILADRNQMSQALLNICLNARDAMPMGGQLTIRTEKIDAAEIRERRTDAAPGAYVCVSISDTGMGMTEEVRARMFEPFFTTKGISEGTGLGLAIVYGIVREHNGFIDVESEPARGTTVRLFLPVLTAEDAPIVSETNQPSAVASSPLDRRATILVVEDEEPLVRLLNKVLPQQGYQVLAAMDGEQGVHLYRDHKTEIDIVLLDLGLPKLTGMEVIPKLKEQNPDVNILIATGYLEPEVKAEILRAGVKDWLHKPYLLNELLEKLDAVLGRRQPMPSGFETTIA